MYNQDGDRCGRLRAGPADRVAPYILTGAVVVQEAIVVGEIYTSKKGRNKGKVDGFLMSVSLLTTLDRDDPQYEVVRAASYMTA